MDAASAAGWASFGAVLISSGTSWIWLFRRNGKAMAKWCGSMEERMRAMEKAQGLCQSNVKENFSHLRSQVERLHERVTHAQGAE